MIKNEKCSGDRRHLRRSYKKDLFSRVKNVTSENEKKSFRMPCLPLSGELMQGGFGKFVETFPCRAGKRIPPPRRREEKIFFEESLVQLSRKELSM
jgi:hypothetical protein